MTSRSLRIIWLDPDFFHEARLTFKDSSHKGWSFTDCTSFELMRLLKITEAFGFDKHFGEAGFHRLPNIPL